ncbi:MAG: thymidine kinase, partial [Agrococcus casei]
MAKLYFRYGAMNSGKSTGLLQAAFNYEERGQRVLLAKPSTDTKGDTQIVSRLGVSREVDFVITPDERIRDAFDRASEHTAVDSHGIVACLLIDEAQFLLPDQVEQLLE